MSEHPHLLRLAHLMQRAAGQHLDSIDDGIIFGRWCGSGSNPPRNDAVLERIGLEAESPLVGNGTGRLGENQTAARIGQFDPPAPILLDDVEEVRRRIIPPQRQTKAPLACERSVAGPGITAPFGQHRLNVPAEAPGKRFLRGGDLDRDVRGLVAHAGDDRRLAVGNRPDFTV